MPLITAEELKNYTDFDEVLNRSDSHLVNDIMEAEAEMKSELGHKFEDPELYPAGIPEDAKLGLLKLAQFYALINGDEAIVKGYKGETIGDYSYTIGNQTISKPSLDHFFDDYRTSPLSGDRQVRFRMTGL